MRQYTRLQSPLHLVIMSIALCSLFLPSCNTNQQSPAVQYIDLGQDGGWSSIHSKTIDICIPTGGRIDSLLITARCDRRMESPTLDMEISLERGTMSFAKDTIRLDFTSLLSRHMQNRPAVYDVLHPTTWTYLPPVAGIYQIRMRPIVPHSPTGVLAIGIQHK